MAFKRYYTLVRYTPSPEPPTPTPTTPFYVEDASGASNTISITQTNSIAPTLTIETSTDGTTWTTLGTTSTSPLDITVPANGKVYIRCEANQWAVEPGSQNYFSSTGDFNVGGNVMSLLYGSNFDGSETSFPDPNYECNFCGLFSQAQYLVDASALLLPATTLTGECYSAMFEGCTSLTSAPALPAETLEWGCYQWMFNGCSALTTVPDRLPSTVLVDNCYSGMFFECTSLTTAPTLPAVTLTESCYASMFSGCASLTTAPVLPALMLTDSCYNAMFSDCTALTEITCLAIDISAPGCTSCWLDNVAASGTFHKDPTMYDWQTDSPDGIPTGWTVQDAQ